MVCFAFSNLRDGFARFGLTVPLSTGIASSYIKPAFFRQPQVLADRYQHPENIRNLPDRTKVIQPGQFMVGHANHPSLSVISVGEI
jgi:hypothetical protein